MQDLVKRLLAELGEDPEREGLVMIGRRHLRSNNSWLHNVEVLVKGRDRCTLLVHPDDAAARGIADGDMVRIHNDRGEFSVRARITDAVRPGVVVAVSVWWKKLSPDGRNANEVTSTALADMGGAATYYDVLVEVARAGP